MWALRWLYKAKEECRGPRMGMESLRWVCMTLGGCGGPEIGERGFR